ncbi:DUF262 domain-containing protein [Aliarcobacter butzleri]
MAKPTFEEQEEIINSARKNVNYDTKEFTLELLHSKFNRLTEDGKTKEITIPFYQRNFVWNNDRKKQSRFIESILLDLPIPPMFFAETEHGILEVVDGSQRIRTINEFLNNGFSLTKLEKIPELEGLKFEDFKSSRQRMIKNKTLRSIVLYDLDKDVLDISQMLFDRLNTGGANLTKMEIIKGSQSGKFIDFIFEIGEKNKTFNDLSQFYDEDEKRGYREEFLIKYFAFSDSLNFDKSISDYLNCYIDDMNGKFTANGDLKDQYLVQFKSVLDFLKNNSLITDIKINRKNRLLATYIGTNLALQENNTIAPQTIFTEIFCENAKSNSFSKLKENIELVKKTLLG